MRSAALAIIRALGVEGGCNVQFALIPDSTEYAVIEVNPRVSRSSALASKATGYPIARVAAKIAIGRRLDEIPNAVTGTTVAAFEPALDYVVVKMPRWPFDKFPSADRALGTQMKATGEVMAIDRTFGSALNKALRGLEQAGANRWPRIRRGPLRSITWPPSWAAIPMPTSPSAGSTSGARHASRRASRSGRRRRSFCAASSSPSTTGSRKRRKTIGAADRCAKRVDSHASPRSSSQRMGLVDIGIAAQDGGQVVERSGPRRILGQWPRAGLLEAAERLVQRRPEGAVDGHDLAGRLHLEPSVRSPFGNLSNGKRAS